MRAMRDAIGLRSGAGAPSKRVAKADVTPSSSAGGDDHSTAATEEGQPLVWVYDRSLADGRRGGWCASGGSHRGHPYPWARQLDRPPARTPPWRHSAPDSAGGSTTIGTTACGPRDEHRRVFAKRSVVHPSRTKRARQMANPAAAATACRPFFLPSDVNPAGTWARSPTSLLRIVGLLPKCRGDCTWT